MTTARSLALSLSIGGVVASSLPTSTSRVSKELDRLRDNATDSRNEMRRLQARLRGLDRDTQEYQDTLEEVNRLRGGLANTGQELRDLSVRQRELSARSRSTRESFAGLAVAATAAAGVFATTAAAIGAVAGRVRELQGVSATTGVGIQTLDNKTRKLSVLLGDPPLASAAVESLADFNARIDAFDYSNVGAAIIGGLAADRVHAGVVTLEDDVVTALRRINEAGDEFARRNLIQAVGEGVVTAASALVNASAERLALAERISRAGQLDPATVESFRVFQGNVQLATTSLGVMRTEIASSLLPTITTLADHVAGVAQRFANQSDAVKKTTGFMFGAVASLAALGVATRGVTFAVQGLLPFLTGLRFAWAAVATAEGRAIVASRAGAVATGIRTAITAVLSSTLLASVGSWIAATAAAIGFNVATGGVLLAIGAVIGGIVLLVRNWDRVSEAFVSAGRFIGGVFDRIPGPIKTLISVMFPIVGVVRLVVANFDTLRSVAERVFGAIRTVIEPVWTLIMGIGSVLGFVGSLVTGSATGIPSPLPAGSPGRGAALRGQGEAMHVTNTYNITGVTNPDEVARRVGQSQARSLQVAVEPRAGRRG